MFANVARVFKLEIAHSIPSLPVHAHCARLHGHSLTVTVVCGGVVDETLGVVLDFQTIADAWAPVHEALDHRYLNEVEGLELPTMERIAAWIWRKIVDPLTSPEKQWKLIKLTVSEGDLGYCEFFGAL